ncbi:type VII secretion-associated serine protease mycosin [Actinoplanes sp. CA-142083]|uniref:type VII secretion-associated serine protease mycosin n=1 Tax=Actinoplanes sp. CA-142083 TaxID=3239903 RepID=UPI003D8E5DCE
MLGRRLAAATVALCAVLVAPAPAQAVVCEQAPPKLPVFKGTPPEDEVYAPKRLAPIATGKGVRVAVVDSGVDATHPQLRDNVERGADFLHGDDNADQDCVGHGTEVASIIAARPASDTGFQGLAPGATIVPVRISEQKEIDGKAVGDRGTPRQFAQAIDWAVDQGDAQVINLSLVMTADNAEVAAAVQRALDAGVVVVAAAGNNGAGQTEADTPYPADFPGVIGVGAVTLDGTRADFSQKGDYVDLVAYGKDVTAAARGSGHLTDQGTSFSTPFVTATVALMLERFPGLTPAQVLQRLKATADPPPGGTKEYGAGLLNPYRAITESLGPDTRNVAAPQVMHPDDPAVAALAARRAHSQQMALLFAAIGAGLVVLLAAAALIVRRGRARGWRPAGPGHR